MPVNASAQAEEKYYILAPSDLPAERDLVLKHNDTFGLFDRFGDLDAQSRASEGLYHKGSRFLSGLKLKFANGRPLMLSSTVRRDNVLLVADLANPDVYFEDRIFLHRGTVHLSRSQFVWKGALYQRVLIRNFSLAAADIRLAIEFAADYADIFEVRGIKRERRGELRPPEVGDGAVTLSYEGLDGVVRRTVIHSVTPPRVTLPESMHYTLRLGPGEERCVDLTISCEMDQESSEHSDYVHALSAASAVAERSEHLMCQVTTSNERFNSWLERSQVDLDMLLTAEPQGAYPYAGVPWFATPFGRDGVITALECLWIAPAVARGVLGFLSATQATEINAEQDAEPGKILHEARDGEMARLGEVPFRRYYGSVDSTPLYLILAGEYYRRTGDLAFIKSIWPNIELAVQWINQYGDADHDGFVEYSRKSPEGLANQGWKDSQDAVFHADGTLAQGPIALCEVQGYVYAAKLEVSGIATALGEHPTAQRLMREAQTLHSKFEETFWCEELGTYALALDGDKRRCEVRSSNAGHCLFTGLATPERAQRVAAGLMEDRFYTGWGIRTVADSEARYNPMSYHNGSVWPHDNALIAAGFARYSCPGYAAKVLSGIFEVATELDFSRLPELFCGFPRRAGKGPVSYPVACSPQAWAAAAGFLLLQSAIGLSIDANRQKITLVRPVLPSFLDVVKIRGLQVGEASVDLLLFRSGDAVATTVERRVGNVEVVVLH